MSPDVLLKTKNEPKLPAKKSGEQKKLVDLFQTYRDEGWSDAQIEIVICGQ